jgi:hypothetical protein
MLQRRERTFDRLDDPVERQCGESPAPPTASAACVAAGDHAVVREWTWRI